MTNREKTVPQAGNEINEGADVEHLFTVGEEEVFSLSSRLTKQAEAEGLLGIAYRTIDSPIGKLLVASTNQGLVRVAFEREDFDKVLDSLAKKVSPKLLESPASLDPIAVEFDEYFAGTRRSFDIRVDYTLSAGFRQVVQRHLPKIGYGDTQTYKQVAELLGNPKAVRAVGTACATNPLPIVIPCHRVLRTDGGLGGYLGGLKAKTTLLDLEYAVLHSK
ncbi:methylated-DNA--[protein]-cysteine S-methyltransferase [Flaviflexus massiliensis]|uniref:methylated-DNA--[protein]-cysteine S-methyltransferase n=1 Tax=Flaviflexus massiliensis TaxID=1522309 RepID=UPI0006D58A05|nr:methylated-DNA--[protein]-cysteine S-methyltransferase [Flaviflexus massiliensis]